ncbi:MAG: hypothetical protein BWY83_03161 [bacterium ADurb.Bin478]|nr:MAG: hypothetical protein BWY83_03161 [bacterium ADurb.Bin478]
MIHRGRAHGHRQSHTAVGRELIGVQAQFQSTAPGLAKDLFCLLESEIALLAKHIAELRQAGDARQQRDHFIRILHRGFTGWNRMGAQIGRHQLNGLHAIEIVNDLQQFDLLFLIQSIAALDLHGRGAMPQSQGQIAGTDLHQLLPAGLTRGGDCAENAAALSGRLLIAQAGIAQGKLLFPGAGENQMGVAVHQSGEHHLVLSVDHLRPTGDLFFHRRWRTDGTNDAIAHIERGLFIHSHSAHFRSPHRLVPGGDYLPCVSD